MLHTGVFVELWFLAIVFTFSVLFLRGSPGEQFIMMFISNREMHCNRQEWSDRSVQGDLFSLLSVIG